MAISNLQRRQRRTIRQAARNARAARQAALPPAATVATRLSTAAAVWAPAPRPDSSTSVLDTDA